MLHISLSAFVYALIFILFYFLFFSQRAALNKFSWGAKSWIIPCLFALALRLALGLMTDGYATDMSCWRGWSARAAAEGLTHFYADDVFCDYPPGYIHILAVLGYIRPIFSSAIWDTLLYKMPAILADVLLVALLYRKTQEITKNETLSLGISLLYAVCPAVWMNSAIWGQVDAVFTLFVLFSLIYLAEGKYSKSAVLYATAVLIKPQALLFAPIYGITIWQNRDAENFGRQLWAAIACFAGTFVVLILPFVFAKGPAFIFALYEKTLASYPFASLNAFNLFTLIGANGLANSSLFLGVSYGTIGTIGLILAVCVACFIFYKGKDNSRYFYASALLITGVFLLSTKMHERYLFPAVSLLLFAYIYRRDKRILFSACALSIFHYANVAYIYALSRQGITYAMAPDALASLLSLLHLLLFGYMLQLGVSLYIGTFSPALPKEKRMARFEKRDFLIVLVTTTLYAFLAFTGLGNTAAPTTAAASDNIADLGKPSEIAYATVYKGIGECDLHFSFSNDGQNWDAPITVEGSPCFKWTTHKLYKTARFARVQITGEADAVYEAAFFGEDGNILSVSSGSTLFDEQHLAQDSPSYLNSTYFDEIYHARTAFEHINHVPSHYENTHPPLGKYIIGIGIRLFGMNPFGWRFMGTLFGVLMLPLMYILGKKLFKSTAMASITMLLMAFDCMHFSQTRIATIDSYPVFFILLMYFFMYLFYEKAETLSFKRACLYLALSGISFGLAISSKWIGFYAGAGLAILFFIALCRRIRAKGYKALWLCALCLLFFVLVPFAIYYACYIPIHLDDGATNFFQNFWRYQKHMFSYHSTLKAEHSFGSPWYTWPFVVRPIWYYGNAPLGQSGITSSIVGMGNPLLWWSGFAAILSCMGYAVYSALRRRQAYGKDSRISLFVSVGFLSQLVPWMVVTRVVFIYHYFASLPFTMLALAFWLDKLRRRYTWGNRICWLFILAIGLVFLAFFPLVSGLPVPKTYVLSCLKWMNSWILTY